MVRWNPINTGARIISKITPQIQCFSLRNFWHGEKKADPNDISAIVNYLADIWGIGA
jgi:hypothetical protein